MTPAVTDNKAHPASLCFECYAEPRPDCLAMSPRPATLLVVEDENALRESICEFLSGCGYSVLQAADGEQALLIADESEHGIDLLLTDVIMPRLGGRELADRLAERSSKTGAQPKTIFMSGYTDDTVVRRGAMAASVVFLQKPFTLKYLGRQIASLLM